MVLGSFEKGITYPKSLYYSGSAYNLAYAPKGLWFESVAHWDDANNKWLASLFGLSHERILPEKITDENKAWEEYLDRIWRYLQQGSPVQIIKGWESRVEKGQIFHTGMGWRTYWWEGATFTSSHYFTVVGMDESEGILYINDAAYAWLGMGRYSKLELESLKKATKSLPGHLKYVTITFKKEGATQKDENEIESLVKERILKKLKGDPSVYDSVEMWRAHYENEKFQGFQHGLKALKVLQKDLEPEEFKRLLKTQIGRGKKPLPFIAWMDININHMTSLTSVSAEYLEEKGMMREWEWLFKHRMLYEKLRVPTAKLRSIFKSTEDVDQAVEQSTPLLKEMRQTIDEMISHVEYYPGVT